MQPHQAAAVRDRLHEDEEKSFLELLFLLNLGRVVRSGDETQRRLNRHDHPAKPQERAADTCWPRGLLSPWPG